MQIAEHIINWEVELKVPLGLTPTDVHRIKVAVYSLLMNYSMKHFIAIGLKVYCWHKFQ